MTKGEYQSYLCKHCIRHNCKENICELKRDTYKVYKCTEYVSLFACNKKGCKKCGKYE